MFRREREGGGTFQRDRDTFGSRHTKQLGTLGGGNHFVELVYDEEEGFSLDV